MRPIDANALVMKLPNDLPYSASVKRVLLQAPTLDVVPREEVERIKREILSEADKIFMATCLSIETYKAWCELKKKYTEDSPDGKRTDR